MKDWYLLTLVTLLLFGVQRFLYKVSAERKCNTAWTSFAFMGTVALISAVFFYAGDHTIADWRYLFVISLINSAAFLSGTVTTMEALKRVSASIAYPLIRLSTAFVVVFSILYFGDRPSPLQVAGIFLALAVILLLAGLSSAPGTPDGGSRKGFLLICIACLSGAVAAISSKFAALHVNLLGFMALSYCMSMVFSFALRNRLQTERENANHRDALIIGFVMGIVNFAGFYALLRALSTGPLSIIVSVTGMYFVIAIILSVLIYRERLSGPRIAAIVLTVLSIILMRS